MIKPYELSCDSMILISAFRYALGRRTYIVSHHVEAILNLWPQLSDSDKELIVDEIKSADKRHNIGMDMDRTQWMRIVERHEQDL